MRTSKKIGGDANGLLEFAPEVVGEVAVGAHDQAHQTDALVMRLSEHASA
jgi:hypothetical protein